MEHRHCNRQRVRLPVRIWHRGRDLGRFWSNDLGADGICVQPGGSDLEAGDFVTLSIRFPGEISQPRRLSGMVRHVSSRAAGIMFASTKSNTCPVVQIAMAARSMLSQDQSPPLVTTC